MSVIIRLQNLPWSANAFDIRQYFHGLSIPEGGVHIVGGELGDAFIAFSTDEDARQAFIRSNGKIKEVQITLLLSSRTEMQKVIEAARNKSINAFMTVPTPTPPTNIMPSIVPQVNEQKKEDKYEKRDRRRSRSRSRERKDRNNERKRDRRRDRSRSKSRERNRDGRERRRRDRSRSRDRSKSRERDRKNVREGRRTNDKTVSSSTNSKEVRTGVWESPPINQQQQQPPPLISTPTNSANLLATFVANNILPNFINRDTENIRENFQNRWSPHANDMQSNVKNFNQFDDRSSFNSNTSVINSDGIGHQNNQIENDRSRNCCIKFYPFFGGFGGIRRFFNGQFIQNDGIKIINDNFGQRTGMVYVKFAHPDGKDEAMGRNGSRIRNQIINVEHLEDEHFSKAVDSYIPNDEDDNREPFKPQNDSCIVIKSLPPYCKENDVYDIFSNYLISMVVFDNNPNNKCAYVRFNNSDDALNALDDINAHVFDGYPLKVESCLDDAFEKVRKQQESDGSKYGPNKPSANNSVPSNSIVISGLPMKCSERDIIDFFSDIGVMPVGLNLISDERGFTGVANCEFGTLDDAILGFQKNGMPFGSGIISMKYKPTPLPVQQQTHPSRNTSNNSTNMHNSSFMNMNRPPQFFPRNNFMGPRGPMRGPPPLMMGPRMHMRRFPPPHAQNQDHEELAPRGCILLMENVPYKAGLDEILDFLDGFDVPRENVLRKYNPNGLPSGETKVIFNSPDDVFHCMSERRGAQIRNRPIYLTQI